LVFNYSETLHIVSPNTSIAPKKATIFGSRAYNASPNQCAKHIFKHALFYRPQKREQQNNRAPWHINLPKTTKQKKLFTS